MSSLAYPALHKKWSIPLRISSVNVTQSTGNGGFGHIYWRIPNGKLHFCAVQYNSCTRGNMVYSFFVISGLAEAYLAPCQTFFL